VLVGLLVVAPWSITSCRPVVTPSSTTSSTPPTSTPPSPTAPTSTAPPLAVSSTALCGDPDQAVVVSVTRHDPFPENHIEYDVPAHAGSADAGAARALAVAACALPRFPPGSYNCPADLGIVDVVAFSDADGRPVATIDAMPTGCQDVTGLGAPRVATAAFWNLLAAVLGFPAPREYCDPFRGHLPGAPSACGPPLA